MLDKDELETRYISSTLFFTSTSVDDEDPLHHLDVDEHDDDDDDDVDDDDDDDYNAFPEVQ